MKELLFVEATIKFRLEIDFFTLLTFIYDLFESSINTSNSSHSWHAGVMKLFAIFIFPGPSAGKNLSELTMLRCDLRAGYFFLLVDNFILLSRPCPYSRLKFSFNAFLIKVCPSVMSIESSSISPVYLQQFLKICLTSSTCDKLVKNGIS
jgi:hypothetical protein